MYNRNYIIALSLLATLLMGILSSLFTVDQRTRAVIFQFGEAVKVIDAPGLAFKIPLMQNTAFFDNRILHVEVEAKELTALDGKRVIIDAFAKFRIVNPVIFYKTVYNLSGAHTRINRILESQMRKVIGTIELTSLLSPARKNIIENIKQNVKGEAHQFGVEIVDVRILRADLPKENSTAIYGRMQTEREKEARQIRAEGYEEAARIRSKADKESKIIIADAYKTSEIIKGEGEGQATKIFNEALGKDVEFYSFVRYLQAYQAGLNRPETTIVLSPKSKFLQHLNLGD
ncbi:MAG: protease modulator HflC [Alphaproteobacteria bacterium]|nr:protease modulator HflC [Alphaproteobacteria bacterium]